MSLWTRVANVCRGDVLNREIDEEFASHIAEAVETGRDPDEARRAFGSPLRQREASRDTRVLTWLDGMRADVIFGLVASELVCNAACMFLLGILWLCL